MKIEEEIEAIRHPENIKDAFAASSPMVLRFVFDDDPHVKAMVGAGRQALAPILLEVESHGPELHDISLSCLAYVIEKIDASAAPKAFEPLFGKLLGRPDSFAAMFIARSIRSGRKQPVDAKELYFSRAELEGTFSGRPRP